MRDGLHSKEVKNAGVEQRKIKDLQVLKGFGGPFTSPDEVDQFLSSNIDDTLKGKRMYTEVRYARDTSLTLPKSSPLFRLKDRYQKHLPVSTYQEHIKTYLSKVSCNVDADWGDFDAALTKLSG